MKDKTKNNPLIKELIGKELIDMGFRIDTDGYLIANTVMYQVNMGNRPWSIRQLNITPPIIKPLKTSI